MHGCGVSGYSYAGFAGPARAHGVAAWVTALSSPQVESGHVAAWVGVGGPGLGPGGSDEWIQVGLSAVPGSGNKLYYEVARPWQKPQYVEIDAGVAPGKRHRVAVLELARRRNWWRVWVNGTAVSRPVFLPRSAGAWEPIAAAESWDGGVPACNEYAYRLEDVVVATEPGGSWRALSGGHRFQDPGYRAALRSTAIVLTSVFSSAGKSIPAAPPPSGTGAELTPLGADPGPSSTTG